VSTPDWVRSGSSRSSNNSHRVTACPAPAGRAAGQDQFRSRRTQSSAGTTSLLPTSRALSRQREGATVAKVFHAPRSLRHRRERTPFVCRAFRCARVDRITTRDTPDKALDFADRESKASQGTTSLVLSLARHGATDDDADCSAKRKRLLDERDYSHPSSLCDHPRHGCGDARIGSGALAAYRGDGTWPVSSSQASVCDRLPARRTCACCVTSTRRSASTTSRVLSRRFTADRSLTSSCRVTASVRVEAALALGRATARAGVQAGAVDRPTS
jgi:hypothetical protein